MTIYMVHVIHVTSCKLPNLIGMTYSLSPGFWQSIISIEICRDCMPALASSCKKTINGFLCLLIAFLKSKTYQLILKDVIKLNRNLW